METKLTNKELFGKLFAYLKPLLYIFITVIIASVFHSAIDAYIIKLMKPLVDRGLVARDIEFIKILPILLPILFLIRGIFGFISDYGMAWVSRKLILNIRSDLFKKYLSLPTGFFDNTNTGELLSKVIYNVDQLYKACTDIVADVIKEGFTIFFLVLLMLYTSWKLTLVFSICGPVMAVLFVIINKLFRKLSHKAQDAIGLVMHSIREGLDGQQVIRIYGGKSFIINKIDTVLKNYNKREMRQALIKGVSIPSIQLIGGFALSLTLYVSLSGLVDPNLSAGGFATIFFGMAAILKPIKQVTNLNIYLQRALAAADSIFNIMALPAEEDIGTIEVDRVKGHIEFKNIEFKYNNRHEKILTNINLNITAKQTIAFVGQSGAGKSTLLKLLPRFYDYYTGDILIDNINIKDYKLENLRKHIAIVSQNVVLFNDTISNNIAYGLNTESNNMENIIEAAKAAGAYEFIMALPNGFDTMIGENGVLLSGGQRQRLAIARAIFKNAPILILDEATSALDTKLERKIQQALENLMVNKTTLVIAHRLSTIAKADQIVVLDKGKIVEMGSHSELLANNSFYASLYKMQFEYIPELTDL
ncbi:MAG: lipid A export permease/ATP-binding protein MsbA [Gammaproteobacteria bacterium]|nr:lipid A export permease/ATP-binding protein MsbA [Gammaproteobacteria bacterium]